MINSYILQGRLTKDVEYGTTSNGVAYANFTIAWSEKYNETETKLFMNCKTWRATADFLNKYFKKGDMLVAEGRLVTETYEKDGENRSITKFDVDRVHFCANNKSNENDNASEDKPNLTPIDDDSLPF